MKVALIGYGKMGRLLEERLMQRGHEILVVIDPFYPGVGKGGLPPSGGRVFSSLTEAIKGSAEQGLEFEGVDVAIEFSLPDTAAANLIMLAEERIPVVTGTTGWYDKLPEVSAAVNDAGTSLIWASNFSLGVNLFYRIASYAAKLVDPFKEYDVGGFETHHNNKADSPSGTAKTLVEKVLSQMTRKTKAVYEKLDRNPSEEELHFASLRVGSVPGTHSLVFDSASDSIEIIHSSRNREGFATGAVLAAEWLIAKERAGVFTIDDVLADYLP